MSLPSADEMVGAPALIREPPVSKALPRQSRAGWLPFACSALIALVYGASELLGPNGGSADRAAAWISAATLGVAIVWVASHLKVDRRQLFVLWLGLLFLNLASVAVEGTLFAPAAAPPSQLGANLLRLFVTSAVIAAIAATLIGQRGDSLGDPVRRTLPSWAWRVVAVAAVYLTLYLVIGGLNYSLVTKPYYETHAGGLTLPSTQTILLYEPVRSIAIATSLVPLVLGLRRSAARSGAIAGLLLFVVGGLVPLLPQATLPLYLRLASSWEIFGQNFLTGIAAGYLFAGQRSSGILIPS